MLKHLLLSSIFSIFFSIAYIAPVQAVTLPSFPSCSAPQGEVLADYNSGTHGIVGQSQTYTGSDQVYKLNNNQVIQCYCSSDGGTGIQTNWWKYENLSDQDIKILERQGWILIPNGSLWGLDHAPYITRNESYSCNGNVGRGGGNILGASTFANTGVFNHTVITLIGLFTVLMIARSVLNRLKRE